GLWCAGNADLPQVEDHSKREDQRHCAGRNQGTRVHLSRRERIVVAAKKPDDFAPTAHKSPQIPKKNWQLPTNASLCPFWLEIHSCKFMKTNSLYRCIAEGEDPSRFARHRACLQFDGSRHYHFCFVKVTGVGASIKGKIRDCLSLRQVSTFETVGKLASPSAKASAWGEAAPEQQRCRRIHRSYASHRRTVCLPNAHNGRAQWLSVQPSQRACLRDQRFRNRLPRG